MGKTGRESIGPSGRPDTVLKQPFDPPDPNWTEEFFTGDSIDQTLREGMDQVEKAPKKSSGEKIAKKIGSSARPAGHGGMATMLGYGAVAEAAVLTLPRSMLGEEILLGIPASFVAGTAAYQIALDHSRAKHENSVYSEIYDPEDGTYELGNLFESEETEVNSELGIRELGSGYRTVEDREAALSYIENAIESSERFEIGVEKDQDNPFVTMGITGEYSSPASEYPGYERRRRLAEEITGDEDLFDEVLDGAPTEPPVEEAGDRRYEFVVVGQNPDYEFVTEEEPEVAEENRYKDDFRDHSIDETTADLNERIRNAD